MSKCRSCWDQLGPTPNSCKALWVQFFVISQKIKQTAPPPPCCALSSPWSGSFITPQMSEILMFSDDCDHELWDGCRGVASSTWPTQVLAESLFGALTSAQGGVRNLQVL